MNESQLDSALASIKQKIKGPLPLKEKLQVICEILVNHVPHYDWVGFYITNPDNPTELLLGPFVGEPTEHVKIPFGSGICGQAAETKQVFLVPDVSKETNYLSCSPNVKSEIVIPILFNDQVLGELDIDSHELNPFTEKDTMILMEICSLISEDLAKNITAVL